MSKSDFSILLDTTIDTSRIQSLLTRQKYKVKVDLDTTNVGDFTKKLDLNLQKTLQHSRKFTTEISNDFERISQKLQNVTVFDNGKLVNATRYIEQYKNALGDVVQRTTDVSEKNKILNVQEDKISNGIRKITTSVTESTKSINGFNAKVTESTKSIISTDNSVKKIITRTSEWTDSNNRLHTSVETVDEKGRQLKATTEKIENGLGKVGNNANTASAKVRTLGQSFMDCVNKVTKFYLATLPIQTFYKAVNQTIETVKEFDSAITEMGKVSEYSGQQLYRYTETLGELGQSVGRTRTEMVQATTELLKAGYEENVAGNLAQVVALYQNTADEALTASDATSVLVSQMKAFGYETETEALHITDAINQVSADFAVSSGDIGRGLTQAGAALSTYGNSFEQTIGLVTAGTEIFQGKSQQVARGLNTVASRVAKNEEALKEYGVEIYNENGQLKSTFDILSDLSVEWQKMSNAEKVALGTTLAGVNQYKVFSAVMNNFNHAIDATNEAYNSQGATMKQNEVYMQSLQAKVQLLKTEFEKFVLGKGGLQSLAKMIVDLGTALLKMANSDIGGFILKVTALSLGITALTKTFLATTLVTKGLGVAFKELTTAIATNPIGLVAVGVSSLIVLFSEWTSSMMNSKSELEKIHETATQFNEEIEETKRAIESIEQQLKALEGKKINVSSPEDLQRLLDEEESLKRQLAIQQELLKAQQEKASKEAKKSLGQTIEFIDPDAGTKENVTRYEGLVKTIEYIEQLKTKYSELEQKKLELAQAGKTETSEYKEVEKEMAKLEERIVGQKGTLDDLAMALETENGQLDLSVEENKELHDAVQSCLDVYYEYIGVKTQNSELTKEQIEDLADLCSQQDIEVEQLEEIKDYMLKTGASAEEAYDAIMLGAENATEANSKLADSYKDAITALNDMDSAFNTLSGAISEYNSTGQLSLSTISNLLSLGTEYLSLLSIENGQMTINEQGLQNLANARIDEAEAMAISKAEAELEALAKRNLKTATDEASQSSADSATANATAGEGVSAIIPIINQGIEAWTKYWYAESKGKFSGLAGNTEAQKITNSLYTEIQALESLRKSIGKSTASVKAGTYATTQSTGATKANTTAVDENKKAIQEQISALQEQKKALEDQKKALEDQKDNYKTAMDYIIEQLDDYIDELEKQRDAELEVVKKQKEALEEEKESVLEIRELVLEALKEEKDARLAELDAQLEALEAKRDAEKEYYDDKIQQLNDVNNAMDEQIELEKKLKAIQDAKAKKVRVFRDGKFVYESDANAVEQAEQALSEYQEELKRKKQIKELEEERDQILAILDSEIGANKKSAEETKTYYDKKIEIYKNETKELESAYKAKKTILEEQEKTIKEKYGAEIEVIEAYKKAFKDMVDAYEKEQKRQTTAMVTGLELDKQSLEKRVEAIKKFIGEFHEDGQYVQASKALQDWVNQYNSILDQIKSITIDISSVNNAISALQQMLNTIQQINSTPITPSVPVVPTPSVDPIDPNDPDAPSVERNWGIIHLIAEMSDDDVDRGVPHWEYGGKNWDYKVIETDMTRVEAQGLLSQYLKTGGKYILHQWYKGTPSISDDQMAIVGEDPNKEIVIGSKLNNGVAMNLSKGSGVVNAKSTSTLAGLLNAFGSYGNKLSGYFNERNGIGASVVQQFSFGNITLPNVTDANSFVNELANNFKSYAVQYGNVRS